MRKEHVLIYDCKRVVRDLWFYDEPPTLKERRLRIEHKIQLVNDIKQYCENED